MRELDQAEAALRRIRQRIAELRKAEGDLSPGKYSREYIDTQRQVLRSKAAEEVDRLASEAGPTLAELDKMVKLHGGAGQLERARFVRAKVPEFATSGETAMLGALSELHERLAELTALQRLERTPTELIGSTFHDAIERGELATARCALGELRFRAVTDDAARSTLARAEARVRTIPPPPEAAPLIERARQMRELIDEAKRSIETGRDIGAEGEAAALAGRTLDAAKREGKAAHVEIIDGVAQAVFDN
jgi:hypothetical protein